MQDALEQSAPPDPMALPLSAILKTLTTLGSAVGVYVARQKEEKIESKREDAGKIISDLQADVQKQTAFIASLTKEMEALALQVQQQQASIFKLRIFTLVGFGILLVLLMLFIWMAAASVRG